MFIGLYDPAGSKMEFFDVEEAPPRNGRPKSVLSYLGFLDEIEKAYLRRNVAEFEWADEEAQEDDNSEGLL